MCRKLVVEGLGRGAISRVGTRLIRSTCAVGATLALCVGVVPARAAGPPSPGGCAAAKKCEAPPERPDEGSGYQMSLGAAYLLPTASAVIMWSARSWTSAETTLAVASPMVLAAP